MGHVIEFGHSLVLERLGARRRTRAAGGAAWTAGLPVAGEPWRFMSHTEWQQLRVRARAVLQASGQCGERCSVGARGETKNVTYRRRQITLGTRGHSGG